MFISVSVKDYRPYVLTSEYVVASHNSFGPLKTCRYIIVLIPSSTKDLLKKHEDLSCLYQTVDCLFSLYKHQFFGNILEESEIVSSQLDRAVKKIMRTALRSYLVCPKKMCRKKLKRHLLRAEQRNVTTQTMVSSFLELVQSLTSSKHESELIKIVDCLLDGHGLIDNTLFYLEIRK